MNELEQLVADIGERSLEARHGRPAYPDTFDEQLWRNLEETGLSRLTSTEDAGPAEAATVLTGLARSAAAVPIAETDLLAMFLAAKADVAVPETGPLTVALADAELRDGTVTGTAHDVLWADSTPVVVAAKTAAGLYVGLVTAEPTATSHNLAGEPRGTFAFDFQAHDVLDVQVVDEFTRRGAWARCVQVIGALDAARDLTVTHTSERVQFGRPLSKFQAVQHSLAEMAGEIERARAATDLAVTAATDFGFDSAAADYAVTVAKVAVGRAVESVTRIAHQLHGAIGVTVEHRLWLFTMRARSWVDDFGATTQYARRLGRIALAADDPWQIVVSCPEPR
ncbi:acyl-CoA dehydrogenase family protein [Mycolicibacterium tusciae]|uniref:Acyl-CoA dehydrogenase n=1 Tax=Mycolicibacterium tusciae TaxID=75922 RepID=A0A1X0JIN7_9MYCO|nr:acyl-CoA dehydrogenase family protein [Mycolicibacterium tusciae]ORB62385.1 acyl-CoA dehydrogenase [Mycolicibacterium tusciae]